MYCAPKGEISQLYYPELDIFFLLKINKIEKIAAQKCTIKNNYERQNFIREYTLNELWAEYCQKQENCNKEYHQNKKKTLGNNIQQMRLLSGLTIQEISERLHFSIIQIESWERGIQMPTISEIKELSHFFLHPFEIYIKNSYYA